VEHLAKVHRTERIGVIGMCVTGAFVIPLVLSPLVKAAVASQPAIPFSWSYLLIGIGGRGKARQLNVCDGELAAAAARLRRESVPLLALRFREDRICQPEKIERLRDAFGDRLEVRELSGGKTARRRRRAPHAVLTEEYDRACDPSDPTRDAYARVVEFFSAALS
jgi:dienelactone hydrolase